MSKPRTFVSSTFYDLADARSALKAFLESIGHEPVMSETSTFGVTPGKHAHKACLDQVALADYFVLIIDGRRSGSYLAGKKSITNKEYDEAVKRGIPIITFIRRDVDTASRLYKKSPTSDFKEFVDDTRVPEAREEYLTADLTAFDDGQSRWRFPVAAMELENSPKDDRIAYSLWKVLCIKADLRVVFCYRKQLEKAPDLVSYLADEVISAMDLERRAALAGDVLVIVGGRAEAETFPYGFFSWWKLDPNTGRFGLI